MGKDGNGDRKEIPSNSVLSGKRGSAVNGLGKMTATYDAKAWGGEKNSIISLRSLFNPPRRRKRKNRMISKNRRVDRWEKTM